MATATGNIRGMYDGIKKALGPMQRQDGPLKSATGEVITDQGQQMERWVKHYSNLYSRENTAIPQPGHNQVHANHGRAQCRANHG